MFSFRTGGLELKMLSNATATPFMYSRENGEISGSIYDGSGRRVDTSLRISGVGGDRLKNVDPETIEPQRDGLLIEQPCLYLGHFMNHYGHFITETLSTFWATEFVKAELFVFHKFIFGVKIERFMEPIFDCFGITREKLLIVSEDTKFTRIVVPERTFGLNRFIHVEHCRTTDKFVEFAARSTGGGQNEEPLIFVSRSKLPSSNRSVRNSEEVDRLFSRYGFSVMYPESEEVVPQITLYAKAKILAGFSGSALHNCLFMRSDSVLIELLDRRSPSKPLLTQAMCNTARGLTGEFIPFKPDPSCGNDAVDISHLEDALRSLLAKHGMLLSPI